jgi:hypothetical protein
MILGQTPLRDKANDLRDKATRPGTKPLDLGTKPSLHSPYSLTSPRSRLAAVHRLKTELKPNLANGAVAPLRDVELSFLEKKIASLPEGMCRGGSRYKERQESIQGCCVGRRE